MEASMTDLQALLKKTEEERDRLRNNILTLKAKIIDTATLINLFTDSKAANKKLEDEVQKLRIDLENSKRTSSMIQTQLEVLQKESVPQRELIESQKLKIEQLKQQVEKKESQHSATKVYVEQLQHEVAESANLKKEKEKLQKEVIRLRKDVSARDDQLRTVRRNLDKLSSTLSTPPVSATAPALSSSTSSLPMQPTGTAQSEEGLLDETTWQPATAPEEISPSPSFPPPPLPHALVADAAPSPVVVASSPVVEKKSSKTEDAKSKPKVSKTDSATAVPAKTPSTSSAPTPSLTAKRKPTPEDKPVTTTTRVIDAQSTGPPLPPGDEPQLVKRPKRTELPATMRTSYAATLGQKREVLTLAELRRLIQSHVDDSDPLSSAVTLATKLAPAGKDKIGSSLLEHLQLLAARTSANTAQNQQQHDRAITALSVLVRMVEQKRGDFEQNFLEHVARALLPPVSDSSDSATVRTEKRLQCMLFIAICKERSADGLTRARVLCYDILCIAEETLGVALLASVARLWPAVLTCNHDLQSADWDIIGTSIAFNMMQRFESSDPQTDPAFEHYRLIKQFVGWQVAHLNLDGLLAALLETFISAASAAPSAAKLPPQVFSAMRALELMGVFAGWEWTYERLIRQIWTVMNRAPPSLFGAILKLMGRLAQQGLVESESAPTDALYDLRLKFAHILDPSSGAKRFTPEVQVAAAQALLDISDGRRENVEPVLVWYRSITSSGPAPVLPASLQHSIALMLGAQFGFV